MESKSALAQAIARFAKEDGINTTSIEGLTLYRSCMAIPRIPVVYQPSICVVAQGRKQLYFGDQIRSYDTDHYLISSLTLPAEAEILDVEPDRPYLGLSLAIDSYMVSQLILEMDRLDAHPGGTESPDIILAGALTDRLEDCFTRLVESVDHEMDRVILAPGLKREIFYEVLKGSQGHLLRNCISNHAGANRIAPVVHFIEANFNKPLDIETIAKVAGMSPSTLHEHFKQITSQSPMQFIKSLRLHQARTMLLGGHQASEVSYQVGYSSPSQFSREFKRFFGDTPREVQAVAVG